MSSYITTTIRCSLVLLIITLLVSGCSSSRDSNPDGSQSTADVSGSIEGTVTSDNGASDSTSEIEDTTIGDTTSGTQAESTEGENESITGVSEPSIPDPLAQNSIRVEFSISVPAYQSDALQVQLSWNTKVLNAIWIGDELWAASDDFPTDTEHELVVTFSDANGGITLGQYESVFKTGTNDSEDFQVLAEQFNIDQWDNDGDEVTNLDELIAGTNPLSDENSTLSIIDYYNLGGSTRAPISHAFESRLTESRPFFDTFEPAPDSTFPGTISGTVDIDATGNGMLTYNYSLGLGYLNLNGTRTHSENTISWDGVRNDHDGDFTVRENYASTITVIDEKTRDLVEELMSSTRGTYIDTWDTSSDLRGELVSGTSLCKPVAGNVLQTYWSNRDLSETQTITTISKEADDQYWRVLEVTNGTVTSEYFVREVRMLAPIRASSAFVPERAYFKCDFVDF